jgi:NAD(P)-dependent dehydrogenase (short-subunit alcohol dehydrogenase family)
MSTPQYATFPSLQDRVVIITGGATGIGESMVRAFAANHAKVIFLDIQDEAAAALIQLIKSQGLPTPAYKHCDLTDIAAVQATVNSIVYEFGIIDTLINNAANDTRHNFADVTSDSWDANIAVNLKHQFFMSQAVVPTMKKAGRGSIVTMSSISWMIPSTEMPVYVTSKAAIIGMTRSLAHDLGKDNIRVNCVTPGCVLTERQKRLWMTPEYEVFVMARQSLKRHIAPEEIARVMLFLAADDSSAMTGQNYVIDGGFV